MSHQLLFILTGKMSSKNQTHQLITRTTKKLRKTRKSSNIFKHYPNDSGSRRLTQAPRDAGFALEYVKEHATTREQREMVCNALIFKTNVLWVQLDALQHAYVEGQIPPGAFVPKG